MTPRPEYFEQIRESSARRWEQLEKDPELAGPWHQLFKQVQSPRHILSELLQNADDAGATRASVQIENGVFIFKHNGEDFIAEHFASLCRFGYSNKRALHTIGFRGIGFKSTFSLGDRVELSTPTLSVAFDKKRFTEPFWIDAPLQRDGLTQVRVRIRDHHRQREVEKNLQEWLKSPVSLLFFKNIRYIRIQDNEVQWRSLGPGPVANTEWVELVGKGEQPFLFARSAFENFPEEALAEIKEERMLTVGEDIDFPPCQVEIVLGAKGRLFVVLPTGVETKLPFACNAPFIQDPARLKIKDPETSPTNRWLLKRAGKLATSVMLKWLENEHIDLAERAQAYALLPDINVDDSSLEGICETIVEKEFDVLEDKECLLTDRGILEEPNQSIIIPKTLLDVWPTNNVSTLLDDLNRPALTHYVSDASQKTLVKRGLIKEITRYQVFRILENRHLPRPENWDRLLRLWVYISPELTGYKYNTNKDKVHIVPVKGKDVLYSASEVVRLGERNTLQASEEWEFLATYLLVFHNDWARFLADQQQRARDWEDEKLSEEVGTAFTVMRAIGIEGTSDASQTIEKVSAEFFSKGKIPLSDCVRLAQIAAKIGATARTSFRFVAQDTRLYSTEDTILFDEDGTLEYLLPSNWGHNHLLHSDYSTFKSCTKEEWIKWISSGRAGLYTFVLPVQKRVSLLGHQNIEQKIRSRGYDGSISFHYTSNKFAIEDWDFEEMHWNHWQSLAKEDDKLWGRLVERILDQPETFWSKTISAKALHVNKSGGKKPLINDPLAPEWISKLRDLPCLPDTRGFYRKPAELLRRTPATEPFMDMEPFIHGKLDNESNRQLLDLLGVSSTPIGPGRLLDCLRALSGSEEPPVYEVEKWYRRLDLMADSCSTTDFLDVKKAFHDEKLVLTEDLNWVRGSGVFLNSDEEDVPGAAVIRASVRDLSIWRKIGIPERPTADLAIQWLQQLPSGRRLSQEDARRVRALLGRHSLRIWNECGHWLNLEGGWTPVETINYSLSMQSLIPWSHLYDWVKRKTADFRMLAAIAQTPPFSEIPALASHIEERFHQSPSFKGNLEEVPWLKRLGSELRRIILDDENNTASIRALAAELAETKWQVTRGLETIPYIEGIPAGTSRRAEVLWLDRILYVDELPKAKLARKVPEKLAKDFNHQDISAALNYCYGRSPWDVTEYIEENFELVKKEDVEEYVVPGRDASVSSSSAQAHPVEQTTASEMEEWEEEWKNEESCEDTPEEDGKPKKRRSSKQTKPSIIERFARRMGYKKDGENSFYHPDGSRIKKVNVNNFQWERYSASGELVRSYWPKDHCLQMEPLQLDAEVWGLVDRFPQSHAFILSDPEGEPVELTGESLRTMREEGEITLYPATYRIVYEPDQYDPDRNPQNLSICANEE